MCGWLEVQPGRVQNNNKERKNTLLAGRRRRRLLTYSEGIHLCGFPPAVVVVDVELLRLCPLQLPCIDGAVAYLERLNPANEDDDTNEQQRRECIFGCNLYFACGGSVFVRYFAKKKTKICCSCKCWMA